METNEEKGKYETEVSDAMNMLGTGYEQPSVVVVPPRTITARHNGKMVELDEPAWVKFSTDFKSELKNMDEYALKVFIFIGLSVNFKTGKAFPGVRLIASETGMDKDTVTKAVEWLSEAGFLTIFRREGMSNIYKPMRYFSIGTVPPQGTPPEELSLETTELSLENEELSLAQEGKMHNKNNKTQQDISHEKISKAIEAADMTMDRILAAERGYVLEKTKGKTWKHRQSFETSETAVLLADLCVMKFGEPAKKDIALWMQEISSWVSHGVRPSDWTRMTEIVSEYTTPAMGITGISKAIKFAATERREKAVPSERKYHIAKPSEGIDINEAIRLGIVKGNPS